MTCQDLSYKLKVNEFNDSTNTKRWITKVLSSLRSNEDANSIAREERGCLTAPHHNPTTDNRVHVRSPTRRHQPRTQDLAL